MKTFVKSTLGLAVLLSLTLASRAVTLVDDTFADGNRTNLNYPTDCPWFFSGTTNSTTTASGINYTNSGGSTV
ncbi:MAG: hypothetical protein RLZZ350_1893, partial [Verrucomicrobiota bacterium]